MSTPQSNGAAMTLMDFVNAAKAQIDEVPPQQAQQLISDESRLLLVDVREPGEFEQGRIADALLIPRGTLEAAADPAYPQHSPVLAEARDRPVLLYCATGGRSALAAVTLKQMGFGQVYNLDGGFTRWEQEGQPVDRSAS